MRIFLTHSPGRLEGLVEGLERRGHQVTHHPLVVTRPRAGEDVRSEAQALLTLPWLLFTSRSAVEAWTALGVGWAAPDAGGLATRVGAVGRKTASALRRAGVEPSLIAERASRAAGLADAFLEHPEATGPVGLPQGDRALPTLRKTLERAGFETRPLVLYETVTQPWPHKAEGSDQQGAPELVVLASPSAAQALPAEAAAAAALVAIGPTTAAALEERGLACRTAETPGVGGVLAEVEAVASERQGDAAERAPEDAPQDAPESEGGRA